MRAAGRALGVEEPTDRLPADWPHSKPLLAARPRSIPPAPGCAVKAIGERLVPAAGRERRGCGADDGAAARGGGTRRC